MMSNIGQPERATQRRVISLFRDELQYRYLGDWADRNGVVFQKWRWPFLHRPPKGIAVDKQANHDVMHLRGFGEADRLAD
jgi:hypothetical protein